MAGTPLTVGHMVCHDAPRITMVVRCKQVASSAKADSFRDLVSDDEDRHAQAQDGNW